MNRLQPVLLEFPSIDDGFRWSLHQDLAESLTPDITASLERFGIIHPPLVRGLEDGSYEVVSGARRCRAARDLLRLPAIDCLRLPSAMPVDDLLSLVLMEQRLAGPLSPIERARFLLLCHRHGLSDRRIRAVPELGGGSRRQHKQLLSLLDLEPPLREALHDGVISDRVGIELAGLSGEDRRIYLLLTTNLGLNHNKQRRVLDLARIIAVRQSCSLADLFTDSYADYLTTGASVNRPQATSRLLRDLQRRSSPLLSRAEQRFAEQVAELGLPDHCSVSHSPAFEQDRVTLHIEWPNFGALAGRWQRLKDILEHEIEPPSSVNGG